jgi:prepilin-type N-terminal cleavage/methylation domain-containing protein
LLRKPFSDQRGVSMPEVMTAVMIAVIVMTVVAALFKSVVGAAGAQQVDRDLVQSADDALYRIQRDVRQSDPNGIFACTRTGSTVTCTPGSELTAPTDVQYLAILTARASGSGIMEWDASGRPAWTGFEVYWLVPDGRGANGLAQGFAAAQIGPGANPTILNADVINAVTTATSSLDPLIVAQSIKTIQTSVDVAKDRVAIRIASESSQGVDSNSTSVQSDAYARN